MPIDAAVARLRAPARRSPPAPSAPPRAGAERRRAAARRRRARRCASTSTSSTRCSTSSASWCSRDAPRCTRHRSPRSPCSRASSTGLRCAARRHARGRARARRSSIASSASSPSSATISATAPARSIASPAELREQVMKLRMLPIARVFTKYHRTVRELAHACGKQARLELVGDDTELDKVLVEQLDDPLMHLVRNADRSRHRDAGRARAPPASPTRAWSRSRRATAATRSSSRCATTAPASIPASCARRRCEKELASAEELAAMDDRAGARPHLPPRLLDGGARHRRQRPRRRHGRGARHHASS